MKTCSLGHRAWDLLLAMKSKTLHEADISRYYLCLVLLVVQRPRKLVNCIRVPLRFEPHRDRKLSAAEAVETQQTTTAGEATGSFAQTDDPAP